MRKKVIIISSIIVVFLLSILGVYLYFNHQNYLKEQKILEQERKDKELLEKINSHYNEFVKSNKETSLFELIDNKYEEIGKINKDVEILLAKDKITIETKYFKIDNLNYYIKYQDVDKIETLSEIDKRYKKYIPFNQNVITTKTTNFYNKNGLVYSINKSFSLPILVKENDKNYVEYNNQLLYIMKENVSNIIDNNNTTENSSTRLAVFNYHGFYDPNLGDNNCQTIICLTNQKFEDQLKYITDNNFLTVTMWEFERYIEGNLRLPVNSVLLTIDDGGPGVTTRAIPLLEKYDQMATLFIVTVWFEDLNVFKSKNLELHSHSHNLHNQYECPGYGEQGGAIMCKNKKYLLDDLAISRGLLNNTTAFAYPFYDFNEYSISVLKEAGFTIAFRGGYIKATVGVDKFRVPRFTVMSYLTLEKFKELIN